MKMFSTDVRTLCMGSIRIWLGTFLLFRTHTILIKQHDHKQHNTESKIYKHKRFQSHKHRNTTKLMRSLELCIQNDTWNFYASCWRHSTLFFNDPFVCFESVANNYNNYHSALQSCIFNCEIRYGYNKLEFLVVTSVAITSWKTTVDTIFSWLLHESLFDISSI